MISPKPAPGAVRSRTTQTFRSSLFFSAWLLIAAVPALATDLTGVVLDPNHDPAAAVTLKLSASLLGATEPVVLAETATDGGGRFRIRIPDRWLETSRVGRQNLTLTAQSPDRGNGGIVVSRELPLPRHRLTIQLQQWTKRKISLQSAANKPLAGARVKLIGLQLPIIYPSRFSSTPERQLSTNPPGVLQSAGTTDESGIVELLLPPREALGSFDAEIEKNVIVNWSVHSSRVAVPKDWSEQLQVPELRRVPVEVKFNEGAPSDLQLSLRSTPRASYGATITIRGVVDLNREGQGAAVIQDEAFLILQNKSEKTKNLFLTPGFFENSTSLEKLNMAFGKGVKIIGRAISTSGEPAGGIGLFTMGMQTTLQVTADSAGRFQFFAPAASSLRIIPLNRKIYRLKNNSWKESIQIIPQNKETHDLGDVAFMQLKRLDGLVRDANGEPVGDARVIAIWTEQDMFNPGVIVDREEWAKTDKAGNFTIPGLDPDAELQLAAQREGAVTERIQSFRFKEQDHSVSLIVASAHAIPVSGRVVDQSGSGVSQLEVTLRHRLKRPLSDAQSPIGADVDGLRLITDQEGEFATPKSLPPWGEYIALIHTGVKREAVSGWKSAKAGEALVLPTIDHSQSMELTGRILTAGGMPLPNARVVVLTSDGQSESLTNEKGAFEIDRPAGRMPLLIAAADGYLSNGTVLHGGEKSIDLRLPRSDQLPMKSQPPRDDGAPESVRWTIEQKQKLAVKLVDGSGDADERIKAQLDSALARYLPDHVLERMDSLPPNNQMTGQMVRLSLAKGLSADRFQEGLRLLDAFPDGLIKLHALIQFERTAKLEKDERLQLLARIVQDARGLQQADHRIVMMGLLGERLLEIGQRESGEALLREYFNEANKLSPAAFSGYVRGAFAEELSVVDADAALELLEGLTDTSEFNRHLQNIAHELAAIDPDRATALLGKFREPEKNSRPIADARDMAVLRVGYRMVRVAPDNAMQLGRSIKHRALRPNSFSLMAESLLSREKVSDADRKRARQLHDEAWRMLTRVRREEDLSEVAFLYPSTIAALLLQQTAEVAPQQLPYRIWQTIALRRPIEKSGAYNMAGMGCICEMALLIAEVDQHRGRELARWLPNPTSGSHQFANYIQFSRPAAELIAILHPDQCEAALEAVTEPNANQRLRLALVKALLREGAPRARAIRHDMLLWFPDDEDFGPQD